MSGIYDEPELYELACAYRNVPAEVDALQRWCDRHAGGGADRSGPAGAPRGGVRSVLELAAGPAEHSLEFARRGLDATALDRSRAMCARARGKAGRAGLELAVVEADMRDFRIDRGFDLAITMLNSLCHLLTLDDLLAHLGALAAHLGPGALYVVELAHPADYLGVAPRTSSEWTTETDGARIEVRWGGPGDPIDPVSQVTREHVSVTVRPAVGDVRTVTDVVPNRFWTATEITAAVRLEGSFSVLASYGDFDDTTPVGDPRAWRMILILRRDRP
ncbi:MAG: class I SAM-dependent methyltransferase [Streptosporangiaceae bacterium]|nr:class I SAM-dependent methyltransferase [Streptosporangiaceae bacterium]MBV9857755.1 class I SAM-dependent methyltransferase [Streptosporangiaceae bacterium]